jgi:hypothetical protein
MDNPKNVFWTVANILWEKGEDGEVISRELFMAFCEMTREAGLDPRAEFAYFMSNGANE